MEPLKELADIQREYNDTYEYLRGLNAKWGTWNNWACEMPWYLDWAYEQGFNNLKDLRFKGDYKADVTFDMEEGAPLWNERHNTWVRKERLAYKKSQLLKTIWFDKKMKIAELVDKRIADVEVFTYTLQEIEVAYGGGGNAAWRYMYRQPWFKDRRDIIKGYLTRKLKVVSDEPRE